MPECAPRRREFGRRVAALRALWRSVLRPSVLRPSAIWRLAPLGLLLGCSTVDPGQDFQIADVVFDENYFYCEVEPVLFRHSCGAGSGSDPAGGCHFNVSSFRLADYSPKVADGCRDGVPASAPPEAARANYQSAQSMMRRDPDLAPLYYRPTDVTSHPRRIFTPDSADAAIIRDWAERYSSQ